MGLEINGSIEIAWTIYGHKIYSYEKKINIYNTNTLCANPGLNLFTKTAKKIGKIIFPARKKTTYDFLNHI